MKVGRWLFGLVLTGIVVWPMTGWSQERPASADVDDFLRRIDEIEDRRSRTAPSEDEQGAGVSLSATTTSESSFVLWALGVAALIFGAAAVVRRIRQPKTEDPGQALEVEESVWVGRGQRLILVRVRGRDVLVGATSTQLTPLAVLEVAAPEASPPTQESKSSDCVLEGPRRRKKGAARSDAERFADLVQDELVAATAGEASLMNKQQILKRLNSL